MGIEHRYSNRILALELIRTLRNTKFNSWRYNNFAYRRWTIRKHNTSSLPILFILTEAFFVTWPKSLGYGSTEISPVVGEWGYEHNFEVFSWNFIVDFGAEELDSATFCLIINCACMNFYLKYTNLEKNVSCIHNRIW